MLLKIKILKQLLKILASEIMLCMVFVDTRNLPVVITPNLDNVQLGDDLELRCEVKGEPSALISWSRLGAELQRNVQPLGSVS